MHYLLAISLIVLCCPYQGLSNSMPSSKSSSFSSVQININGLTNLYDTYLSGLIPNYRNTENDVLTKLTEFAEMNDEQEFLSWGSLLTQFAPAYSICQELTNAASNSFIKLSNNNGSNIIFTPQAAETLAESFQDVSNADELMVNGIIQTINGIQSAITGPNYAVNGNVLTISSASAQAIYNGLSNMTSANNILMNAVSIDSNVKQLLLLQNSQKAKNYLTAFHILTKANKYAYSDMVNSQNNLESLFEQTQSSSTFTINLSNLYNVINATSTVMANSFGGLANAGVAFINEMKSSH